MDETEFRRLLDLFPVVRSSDYQADLDSSGRSVLISAEDETNLKEWQDAWDEGDKQPIENQGVDLHDAFWEKLKLAAMRKVSAAEAEKFCHAFQQIHKKLVYEVAESGCC